MLGVSSPPAEEPPPPIGRHSARGTDCLTEDLLTPLAVIGSSRPRGRGREAGIGASAAGGALSECVTTLTRDLARASIPRERLPSRCSGAGNASRPCA